MAAVRRLARTLRAEVEQAAAIVAELGEGEAAAVADLRVVHAELMAVVAQRQRLGEVVGQRLRTGRNGAPSRASSRSSPTRSAQRSLRKRGMHFGNRAGSTGS